MAADEDWQDFNNPSIRSRARRVLTLVSHKKAHRHVELLSTLDFVLGALHELMRADFYEFEHVPNQQPQVDKIVKRTLRLSEGRWRRDGKWMAGLHFNSALLRLSAAHHRSLQIVVGKDDKLKLLRRRASSFYTEHAHKPWSYSNIARVHKEVNKLKHLKSGTWKGRTAPFQTAMAGVDETLDLLETWVTVTL